MLFPAPKKEIADKAKFGTAVELRTNLHEEFRIFLYCILTAS